MNFCWRSFFLGASFATNIIIASILAFLLFCPKSKPLINLNITVDKQTSNLGPTIPIFPRSFNKDEI